jgi:hypothetical protein
MYLSKYNNKSVLFSLIAGIVAGLAFSALLVVSQPKPKPRYDTFEFTIEDPITSERMEAPPLPPLQKKTPEEDLAAKLADMGFQARAEREKPQGKGITFRETEIKQLNDLAKNGALLDIYSSVDNMRKVLERRGFDWSKVVEVCTATDSASRNRCQTLATEEDKNEGCANLKMAQRSLGKYLQRVEAHPDPAIMDRIQLLTHEVNAMNAICK